MDEPVVIAAFRSADEAEHARRQLQMNGIDAAQSPRRYDLQRLCDEVFEGGFDIVVARADAERGIASLHRLWPDELRAPTPGDRCPACGASDALHIPRGRIFVIATAIFIAIGMATGQRDLVLLTLVIVAILLLLAPDRRCRACGERWRSASLPADESAIEPADLACPRCGSVDTAGIDRRREKAWTLIVNLLIPPMFLVWPRKPRFRCSACGNEWR